MSTSRGDFPSVARAARAHGVTPACMAYWLRKGQPDRAGWRGWGGGRAPTRVAGVTYQSRREAAEALRVCYAYLGELLDRGDADEWVARRDARD